MKQTLNTHPLCEQILQFSHDVRSPLSALNLTISSLSSIPEAQRRLLKNSIQRISEISAALIRELGQGKHCAPKARFEPIMILEVVENLLQEKQTQYSLLSDVQIEVSTAQAYGVFAPVDRVELSRALSNLIDNAVDSLDGSGRIEMTVIPSANSCVIQIQDNGKGIPPQILSRLGSERVTHGKAGVTNGFGLGVYHAKKTIDSVEGSLSIQSEVGRGTCVTITIPRCSAPSWMAEKVVLEDEQTLVVIDHDQSFSESLQQQLPTPQQGPTFSCLQSFEEWICEPQQQAQLSSYRFLIGYEIGGRGTIRELDRQNRTALRLIEKLGIGTQACLVTSRSQDRRIRKQAKNLGVRLIPREHAKKLPIHSNPHRET